MLPEQLDVARALKKNHQIQYWVRMTRHFAIDEAEFPGTVFHEYLDALKGVPPRQIDLYSYEPWSAHEIAEYTETESEFMTMADKLYPDWSVNRRKELYYDLLRYWRGVLDEHMPDAIIFLSVPHEMYNFVLYRMAQRRSIRTIIIDDTVMDAERYAVIEDYTQGHPALRRTENSSVHVSLDDLSPFMRAYYERHAIDCNPLPPLMKSFNKTHSPVRNAWRLMRVSLAFIRDGSFFERAVKKIIKMFKPDMRDEYRANQHGADLEKSFVYFPLQYQPELTTSPLGGIYVDQLLAIKTAAAALPNGWDIYVKEHPAQIGVHGGNTTPARYSGFYRAIAQIPRVHVIPIHTNTFELIDKARATVTMTGTAAWESILRGKPAIVFGYPWFQYASGILRVKSTVECRQAFEKIASGFKPEISKISHYLSVLDTVSHRGSLYTEKGITDCEKMYRAIEDMLTSFSSEGR